MEGKGKEKLKAAQGGSEEAGLILPEREKGTFDANRFAHSLFPGFKALHKNDFLSDLTLVVGSEKIKCHRMVLCLWSETFRSMLGGVWQESTLEELPVSVDPEDYETFKHMIAYMYTGEMDFVNGTNILSVVALSSYYDIDSLKEACGSILAEIVGPRNIVLFLEVVDQFKVDTLKAACAEYLATQFGELLDDDRLLEMSLPMWAEIMQTDEIQIRSEQQLYEGVIRYANQWLKEDPQLRDGVLSTLLPLVRFPVMPPQYLNQMVEADETLQHLPVVQELLHEAYRYFVYDKSLDEDHPRIKRRSGFSFDTDKCGPGINISDDKYTVTHTGTGSWTNVRCLQPFTPFRNQIEFQLNQCSSVMLGVVCGDVIRSCYAGTYGNAWTWYNSGQIYNAGSTTYISNYGASDVLGIQVDVEAKTIKWYKNGSSIHTTTANFSAGEDVYPIACFSGIGDGVTIPAIPKYAHKMNPIHLKKSTASLNKSIGGKAPSLSSSIAGSSKLSSSMGSSSKANFIAAKSLIQRFADFAGF
ncbi:Kelch-like protein 18 [Balamuthia mandrillaris]